MYLSMVLPRIDRGMGGLLMFVLPAHHTVEPPLPDLRQYL